MSYSHEPQRPFFPLGNPFRMILPKSSQLSPKLVMLLNTFEETLAERLRKLNPKVKDDVLSFSWMNLAMKLLCATHNDIKTLLTDLELPVSDWDQKWIDVYLDVSVKLLDLCIAFSSELSQLNQGHLMLQYGLHNLDSISTSSKQFLKARSSLDAWRQQVSSKNPRIGSCCTILDSLVDPLELPKVKNSAKGKVLMRVMYGVKVMTVFICSVFAAAFSGSPKKLLDLNVVDTYRWAQAFSDLQTNVNGEIRNVYSIGRFTPLKELEAVDLGAKKLYPLIKEDMDATEVEVLENFMLDLGRKGELFLEGLDILTKEVDGFFQIVLSGRDALLSNLRTGGAVCDSKKGEQNVRRL